MYRRSSKCVQLALVPVKYTDQFKFMSLLAK